MNKTNIDILNTLSNLSSDEVFTPPEIAIKMLDLLPKDLFCSPNTTFLDPSAKSGVFLREIVKRLDKGLENLIPDKNERIQHILKKQVFGIAITDLCNLMTKRTVYCSVHSNRQYSIGEGIFSNDDGNIYYKNCMHEFGNNNNCKYCGINKSILQNRNSTENYAYSFIHENFETIKERYKGMRFDVIIGNPPYHLNDGSGGSSDSAAPIYQKFIDISLKLNPRYLVMIIPSKWMVGGRKELDTFRKQMISTHKIKRIYDFEDSKECFPNIHLDGGVCYFLIDDCYNGPVNYTYKPLGQKEFSSSRFLANNYSPYIIRDSRIFSILNKLNLNKSFSTIVSSTNPYGIRKYLFNEPDRYPESKLSFDFFDDSLKIYGVKGIKGGAKRVEGYVAKQTCTKNKDFVNKYKIFFTTSYSTNAKIPPAPILGKPNEICTETFLNIGPFNDENEMLNCEKYINTTFFRFLLYFGKGTMQVNKDVFKLIPLIDFSKPVNDDILFKMFSLSKEDINFIKMFMGDDNDSKEK